FLLMFQHKAPHRNWQPSPKYLDWLDDVTIPEPPTLFDTYEGRAAVAAQQRMQVDRDLTEADLKLVAPGNLTPEQRATWDAAYESENIAFRKANLQGKDLVRWKYQRYAKDYLRCVKSVDDAVGQVLDYLDQNGLADNTIVIYSTDNGWYLGEHGWFDKRWMYEESLKVPLLVRWPGHIRPGSVNRDIVSNLDFAETFLDLAGVPVPSDMQGRSLVPIFQGNTPADWRKSFYYHYYEFPGAHSVARHYGVTNGQAKLIHYYDAKEWELFDLKKDPQEMKSLYGQPEAAGMTQELKAELERLRAQYQLPAEDPASSRPQPRNPAKEKGKGKEAGAKSLPKAA
ncbi:MAG: sulfatase/phosphatase domain-containing protein, partial [Verrucomicrobiales bacterium]